MLFLGSEFPDFRADTTTGEISFHQWMDDKWAILFSHPRDFTPVCTTELAKMADLADEFEKRNVKIIALSCNSIEDHLCWSKDVLHCCKKKMKDLPYPIIDDSKRVIAKQLGMLDSDDTNDMGSAVTCRAVFIVGPDKKMKLSILYPATTGRNFTEILRVIDSLQLTEDKDLATPADWNQGDPCMIQPYVKEEKARKDFPDFERKQMPSGKGYMRIVRRYRP